MVLKKRKEGVGYFVLPPLSRMTLRTGIQMLWISYHFFFSSFAFFGARCSVRVLSLATAVMRFYLLRPVDEWGDSRTRSWIDLYSHGSSCSRQRFDVPVLEFLNISTFSACKMNARRTVCSFLFLVRENAVSSTRNSFSVSSTCKLHAERL